MGFRASDGIVLLALGAGAGFYFQNEIRALLPKTSVQAPKAPDTPEEKGMLESAEIFQEMYRVIYMKDPQSPSDFGSWVDTLSQGASFEGVYRGLSQSAEYRNLELTNKGAAAQALKVFGQELARLEVELPERTIFHASMTQPLPLPVDPASPPDDDEDPILHQPDNQEFSLSKLEKLRNELTPEEYSKQAQELREAFVKKYSELYSKLFVGASIFTLKRVLADEALKVLTAEREYPEKFALWYSAWVVDLTRYKIDFGLQLRSSPDPSFHYKWALGASRDRQTWEVLNRIHRILNHFARI